MADQPDQAISQIAALKQHEDDHRCDEPRRAQRPDDGSEPREAKETCHLVGGHHERPGQRAFRCLRRFQIGFDPFDHLLQLLDGTSPASQAHVGNLRPDVRAIAGQVFGQVVHLPCQTPAGQTEGREHQRDHQKHGRDPTDPPLKPGGGRRQDERQKDRKRDGHEDGLRPVQHCDDEHAAAERHPRLHGFRGVQVPTSPSCELQHTLRRSATTCPSTASRSG